MQVALSRSPPSEPMVSDPESPRGPWRWGQAPGSHLPPANLEGRGSQGAGDRAAGGRLRLALATPASPLPCEVRVPSAPPVGGAQRRGGGA